ncbi:MAG: zf-HC2 domain-containing protein [Cellulosilyticum sp.]|nr:zf-HC2 domain-containing protein [Cellulosilyticum sp.]
MKCSKYQILISAYIDGELDSKEEKKLLSHLDKCDSCKEIYIALKEVVNGCEQIEEVPLPKDFHQDLMTHIAVQDHKASITLIKKHWTWQHAGGLVATLLVGTLLVYQIQHMNSQKPIQNRENTQVVVRNTQEDEGTNQKENLSVQPAPKQSNLSNEMTKDDISIQNTDHINTEEMSLQEISQQIRVVVSKQEHFEDLFETYMRKQDIVYKKIKEGYLLESNLNDELLMKWMSENSTAIYLENSKCEGEDSSMLKVIIEESP